MSQDINLAYPYRSGVIVARASDKLPPSLSRLGFRSFDNAVYFHRALRANVMLKWHYQHHVTELSEPGFNDFGFVGTPEW